MVVVEIRGEIEGKKCGERLDENFIYMYKILNTPPTHKESLIESPVRMVITKEIKDNKCCQGCLE